MTCPAVQQGLSTHSRYLTPCRVHGYKPLRPGMETHLTICTLTVSFARQISCWMCGLKVTQFEDSGLHTDPSFDLILHSTLIPLMKKTKQSKMKRKLGLFFWNVIFCQLLMALDHLKPQLNPTHILTFNPINTVQP